MKPASIRLGGHFARPSHKRVEGKAPRYIQNGTGRDSYISHNEGGFASPQYLAKRLGRGDQFVNELRSYERSERKGFGGKSPSVASLHSLLDENIERHQSDKLEINNIIDTKSR